MKTSTTIWQSKILFSALILIFGFTFSTKLNAQTASKTQTNPLKGTKWIITNNKIVGLNQNDKIFELTKKSEDVQIWNYHAIEFIDDSNFQSYDSWECGNDCFTATYGNYKFIENSKIEIRTDSITKYGTCEAPTKYTANVPTQTFQLMKIKDTLKFKKVLN